METIDSLSEEQERLMGAVAAEYEAIALGSDDSCTMDVIQEGLGFLYRLANLEPPSNITVCDSPLAMARQAGLKKGESIDHLGCGYDSAWTAFYDYMQRIGVEYDPDWGFDAWRRFVRDSGVFASVLFDTQAFVCRRPCEVHRESDGSLHNPSGPAIRWRDGYGEYALNGVIVSKELVMTPAEKLDPRSVFSEKNAEIRREIVRKIGVERLVVKLGAKTLDKQGDYELLDVRLGDGDTRTRPYLKMRNPSIGTWHLEGVPSDIRTVDAALTWRNGTALRPDVLT